MRNEGSLRPLARELARPWNLLSLVRIPLAIMVLVYRNELSVIVTLMMLAALSDALDGHLARRANADPRIGAWLDPFCDKTFVMALLVAITAVHEPPWWLIALTAVREVVVVPLIIAHLIMPGRSQRHIDYRARPSGKATTIAQFVVIIAVLMEQMDAALVASIVAAVIGLFAGIEYVMRTRIASSPA
jgi:phosphatidylglycerophosphate synthase